MFRFVQFNVIIMRNNHISWCNNDCNARILHYVLSVNAACCLHVHIVLTLVKLVARSLEAKCAFVWFVVCFAVFGVNFVPCQIDAEGKKWISNELCVYYVAHSVLWAMQTCVFSVRSVFPSCTLFCFDAICMCVHEPAVLCRFST